MSNLNNSFGKPQLIWEIEPENKIRFRYESEGGSHGGLAGKVGKKTYPTLKLVNYHGRKQISVRVSLYTEDKKEHVLDFKGKKGEGSKHYIEEKLRDDNKVEFKNLQIISKKKDAIEEILMEQRLNNLKTDLNASVRAHFEKTYRKDVKERARAILNSVRLYFVAFETNRPGTPLCTLFSEVISNQKAAAKGDLRICRLSHYSGSCKGGEEVILLCDKVQKENIKVRFYEVDQQGTTVWQEYGHFSPADVHYQYAIFFKTPPYRMNDEKKVFICLERNGEVSDPLEYTYKSERVITSSKKRKLINHQLETMPSPEILESSESVSSMSISSPDSSSGVEMSNMFNSHLDDSNQITGIYGTPFGAEDFSAFNDLINYTLEEEGCLLPFDCISSEDDIDGCLNASPIPKRNEKIQNQSLNLFAASGQMCEPGVAVGQMAIFDETDGDYLTSTNTDFIKKTLEKNQTLDLIGIDVALSDLTLKDQSDSKSECELKKFDLNKFLQSRSKDLKFSEIPLQQKFQIMYRLLLLRSECGNTMLHFAILQNENIVPILIMSRKTKVDLTKKQNFKKQTPLHLAVERNKIKAVRILLQSGGNPNLKDVHGNNCYHISAQNNFCRILQEINEYSDYLHNINDFNDKGLTPVHIAIMQNNSEHLFDLLKIHLTDLNIVEKKAGKSLLHYAVCFQPSLLSKLLEMASVDVDIQDFEGNTPLHIACANENIEAVKQLLQAGADPLIKNFKQNHNSLDVENSEDDTYDCQLPADLTTNIEILKLLRIATGTEVEVTLDPQNSDNSQNKGSDEIPCHVIEKLCRYLDDEMKWKKLVPYFFDMDVFDSLSLSSSPTKALLDYVKKQGQDGYLESFKTALEFAQLTDAVNIMNCH